MAKTTKFGKTRRRSIDKALGSQAKNGEKILLICTFQITKQTSSKECNFNLHYREKWETQKRCKSRIRNIFNKKVFRKHNFLKKKFKNYCLPTLLKQ